MSMGTLYHKGVKMSIYEKAAAIADKLTDILRSLPPSPDIPRRTILPSDITKSTDDEINFFYRKVCTDE